MKLLLDECVDVHFRTYIAGHEVFTTKYMGWTGISNGRLLALAAANGFDAMLTTDHSVIAQQNLSTLPLAVVVLDVASNDLTDLVTLLPNLLTALPTLAPRSCVEIRA
jgi:hypothetical protein